MRRWIVGCCLVLGAAAGPRVAWAQDKPGFVLNGELANAIPQLRRTISLKLEGASVDDALRAVAKQADLPLTYNDAILPLGRKVWLTADEIRTDRALEEILRDSGLQLLGLSTGQVVVVKSRAKPGERLQSGVVVGRVTDGKTGDGLVGAEVLLEGTRWRASTGADGRYRLADVQPGNYTLVARRVGYGKQSRVIAVAEGAEVTVGVALQPVATQLDEIVTTVTGDQRRVELGHVVGRINADSLVKEAPVSNLSELLNGRVSGLQVFQSQGTVGGEVRLQVRGPNSLLLTTEPIVIVDGVRHTTARGVDYALMGVELTSRLNDLNPNDIETIEVVKGPSAATLYGTDAANGVIVITTKRGRSGPARWSTYAKGTRSAIPTTKFPDFYWGWGTVFGVPNNPTWNCSLFALGRGWCAKQDSITVLPNPLNDPQLTIFGAKPRWEYGMNVAGGRQDLRYYFSGDFEDATGPIQMPPAIAEQLEQQRGLRELPDEWRNPNNFTKLNIRTNVSAVLGATADLHVSSGYIRNATRSLGNTERGAYAGWTYAGLNPLQPYGLRGATPAEAFLEPSTERTDRFLGSAAGQWRPTSWLTTRATVGLDLASSNRYSVVRRGDTPNTFYFSNGYVADERVRQVATTADLNATAAARRGRLSARTAVGVQYVRNFRDALQAQGSDLPPGGTTIGEARSFYNVQGYTETITLGGYLEEAIGLNERLFLTGALRVDGASAFGRDYNATAYPKVSASWLVSEEPFLPRLPGVDELRLRYAFGASGQQPTPAMARPSFFVDRFVENGVVTNLMQLSGLGNPDLRPERVREHEFGFDATAIANRLRLGLTWYRRRAVDQIVHASLPPSFGFTYTYSNLGLTTQRGFEAELTARLLDSKFLSWDLTLQHSVRRTKLVELGGVAAAYSLTGGYVEGYSLGARFQRPALSYADVNSDGIIGFDEVQLGDTAVYMGESMPPRSQTLTAVIGLFERRLRISTLVERRSGFTQFNLVSPCYAFACRELVDPSTPLAEQGQAMMLRADLHPERADFTRLREVTAALDLPLALTRALRLRSAMLSLSARNLALWSDFSGPDPESTAPVGSLGTEVRGIPQARSWALRLDLGL